MSLECNGLSFVFLGTTASHGPRMVWRSALPSDFNFLCVDCTGELCTFVLCRYPQCLAAIRRSPGGMQNRLSLIQTVTSSSSQPCPVGSALST